MLIEGNKRVVTQRQDPRMALISPCFHGKDELWLNFQGKEPLKLCLKQGLEPNDSIIDFNIWSTPTQGVDMGQEAASWFEDVLGLPGIRLVSYWPGLRMRPSRVVDKQREYNEENIAIHYQDGSPCLLINEESVTDFKTKLPEDQVVSYVNFRPNLLVDDCVPFEEDEWKIVTLNGIQCQNIKLCTRCQIPSINPETGVKQEPVAEALEKYRVATDPKGRQVYGSTPLFGINLAPQMTGEITTGQQIMIE
jgi:uncharacterized protein YcbX